MPRLLVLNNYSFTKVWDEVRRGLKPDHHLYGLNHFAACGYEIEIVPLARSRRLAPLQGLGRWIPLGDLAQQRAALGRLRRGDLIYAPCQTQTQLLCYGRALGILRAPVINLAHHPWGVGRLQRLRAPFERAFVRGSDAFPALGEVVALQTNALSLAPKSRALSWGPDAKFYPAQPPRGAGVVAAGRTARDFETLGRAATQSGVPVHIICPRSSVSPAFADFGSNVQVTARAAQEHMSYPQLLSIYARSRALAIPLVSDETLSGLTSLVDALGMGKPVIMTRHPMIDLDIEALGVGIWVEPNDVEGWRAALTFLEENEDAAWEMGVRARALVDEGFDSAKFAAQMMEIFESVEAKT